MRALCVGECMVELRAIDDSTMRVGYAGDTYNTAVYLRRAADHLNVDSDVGYLTGLGSDEFSTEMRAAWAREGVADRSPPSPTNCLGCTPSASTITASGASPTGVRHRRRGTSSPAPAGSHTCATSASFTCREPPCSWLLMLHVNISWTAWLPCDLREYSSASTPTTAPLAGKTQMKRHG